MRGDAYRLAVKFDGYERDPTWVAVGHSSMCKSQCVSIIGAESLFTQYHAVCRTKHDFWPLAYFVPRLHRGTEGLSNDICDQSMPQGPQNEICG